MDWTQTLVIIISMIAFCGGGFLFLLGKIDNLGKDVRKEIQDVKTELKNEIQKNREDILYIKFRLDPNEHYHWKSLEEDSKEN